MKPERPAGTPGTGRLAGYHTLAGWDPYEDHIGPFYERMANGSPECAVDIAHRHCNAGGIVHGGLLMAFADYTAFVIAREALGGMGATISMTSDFMAPVHSGDLLAAQGEVMRETRSMVFVRGCEFVGERTVFTFSTVIKKIRA
ncbi:MAG: PaaI family thioesterase [Gammaproteobacteria bacterium]|nr:PaaI family thioesterase [Gammaproteobacteria bacterium]